MSKIYAAGAAVFRQTGRKPELAVIHRPRYDDWSLPKGKLNKGELAPVAAVREVAEETGLQVRLGAPLGRISYKLPQRGDKKIIDFWCARILGEGLDTDDEVDELQWLTPARAARRVSSKDYSDLIEVAAHTHPTTPLIIVRHGKARERKKWKGSDGDRPLTSRGRKQSDGLVELLAAYGVQRVISSPAARCAQTVAPFTDRYGVDTELVSVLSEEEGGHDSRAVARAMKAVAAACGATEIPTVVCGHRPLLPVMLRALGLEPTSFATADCLVVHVDRRGKPRVDEFYASPN